MSFRHKLLYLLLIFVVPAFGQKKQPEPPRQNNPSSLSPEVPARSTHPPKASRKKSSGKVTYSLEEQYYDRVLSVAKERRRAEKVMQKPQYSDPMYFGHKRPPRKRPPGKMKYCRECGLRH